MVVSILDLIVFSQISYCVTHCSQKIPTHIKVDDLDSVHEDDIISKRKKKKEETKFRFPGGYVKVQFGKEGEQLPEYKVSDVRDETQLIENYIMPEYEVSDVCHESQLIENDRMSYCENSSLLSKSFYVSLYDFEARNEQEFSFSSGDYFRILSQSASGLWHAFNLNNGKSGLVHSNLLTKKK
eukprot:Awhi_evm1s7353